MLPTTPSPPSCTLTNYVSNNYLKNSDQTLNGVVTLNNNVVIGSSSADQVVINSLVGSSIVPAANVTYDLGTDNLRWKDIYLSGTTIKLGNQQITSNATGMAFGDIASTNVYSSDSVNSAYNVNAGGNLVAGDKVVAQNTVTTSNTISAVGAINTSNTLTVAGAVVANSTLSVRGATNITGALTLGGAVVANNNLNVIGNTSVGNILSVANALQANSTLTASGAANFSNTITAAGAVVANSTLSVANNVNVSGTLTVGNSLIANSTATVTGAATFSNTLNVTGTITASNNVNVSGNIIPSANGIYNLGNTTSSWSNLYLGGSIRLGTQTITSNSIGVSFGSIYATSVTVSGSVNFTNSVSTSNNFVNKAGVPVGYTYFLDDLSYQFDGVTKSFVLTYNDGQSNAVPRSPNQLNINIGNVPVRPARYILDYQHLPEVSLFQSGFILSGNSIVFATAPRRGMSFYGTMINNGDDAPAFSYKQTPFSALSIMLGP